MPGIVNKIYIDSRFKTFDSKSNSNFKIELKENYLVPDNYGAVITDITLPRSWYTVNNSNNRIYFRLRKIAGGTVNDYILTIPSKNYDINTLATAIGQAINTAASPIALPFVVTADVSTGTINISNGNAAYFCVFTDRDMQTMQAWLGPHFDRSNLLSINSILGNINPAGSVTFTEYTPSKPFVSGYVNTMPYEYVYITCNQLSSFENVGPRGERSLLKKVLVNEPFGGLINDNWFNEFDFTDVSRQLLRTLEFRVVDPYGNDIDLNGANVSFSIGLIDISMHRS